MKKDRPNKKIDSQRLINMKKFAKTVSIKNKNFIFKVSTNEKQRHIIKSFHRPNE